MVEMEEFGTDEPSETKRETSVRSVSSDTVDIPQSDSTSVEIEDDSAYYESGSDPESEKEHHEAREIAFGEPEVEATEETTPEVVEPKEPVQATEEEDPEKELLRLQILETEADAKRLQSIVDEHGGKMGHLERQLAALQGNQQQVAPAQPPQPEYQDPDHGYADPAGVQPQPAKAPQPRYQTPDSTTAYLVNTAVSSASQTFSQQHADELYEKGEDGNFVMVDGVPQFKQEFVTALQPSTKKIQAVLLTDDPGYAATQTQQILETAYWRFVKANAASRRKEILRRSASQAQGLQVKKQEAGVTSSKAPAKASPKATSLQDVPEEELDKFLDSHFGGDE